MQANYLLPCCCICDSLKSDMQHDHFLKKLIFNFFTPTSGLGCGGGWIGVCVKIFATILLHLLFPLFDMQHDCVLKQMNFDILTQPPKSTQGMGHRPSIKNHV